MSKHKYEIEAGAIFATLANNVNVGIGLTFYVWDKGRKKAAFCKYLSQSSEKEGDRHARAIIDGTAELSHRGIGAAHSHKLIKSEKDLMKLLNDNKTPGALSFGDPRDGSSALTTATITLDDGHVQLTFAILTSVENIGRNHLNTRGTIFGEKLRTANHHPKIEKNKVPD